MSEKPAESSGQADNVDRIHQLVRMMQEFDLMSIDLVEGPTKIRLRRRGPEPIAYAPVPVAAPVAPPVAAPAAPASPAAGVAPAVPKGTMIESPMVGTFYGSSSPDSPPFVSVGATVSKDTVVCIIEAMKVFTEIPAGVAGTVVEILVKDKQSVEFGQPLFRVEPS
jgi:acetyl-CoA carboxylase biotin carboxyl carrier protein